MMVIEDLHKRYVTNDAEILALSEIGLDIGEGEFVTLLGPSGCGKSTLLKIIAGLLPATAGEVRIDGARVTAESRSRNCFSSGWTCTPPKPIRSWRTSVMTKSVMLSSQRR